MTVSFLEQFGEEPLTKERLQSVLRYEPETGRFFALKFRGVAREREVGYIEAHGYVVVYVGKNYRAHRLAWLYMTGEWPRHTIDHINGLRGDNRWANLRDVPMAINKQNMRSARSDSSTGLLGVHKTTGSKTFRAQIRRLGVMHHLGSFPTAEEASAAYLAAKRRIHEGALP